MLNLDIDKVAELILAGLTTTQVIVAAVQADRARVHEANVVVPTNKLDRRLSVAVVEAKARAAQAGDEAAARIEAAAGSPDHVD